MVHILGSAQTAAGQVLTAAVDVTIVTAPPTRFGLTPDNTTTATNQADVTAFAGNKLAAIYGQPGAGLPSWTGAIVQQARTAGIPISWSCKDANLAAFTANWDNMPADGRTYDYIYFHEYNRPTGAPSLASWSSFYASLIAARNAHAKHARIRIGVCFSWFPAAIGNNEGVPWRTALDAVPGLDFVAWDQYQASGITTSPSSFASLIATSQAYYPVPHGIREFGVKAGVHTDTQDAAFINGCAAQYIVQGLDFVSYFNPAGGVTGAYLDPINRPLAYNAWKAICANQHP